MNAYRQQLPRGFYNRGSDRHWGRITTKTRWELWLLGHVLVAIMSPLLLLLAPLWLVFLDDPLYPKR